jgi:alkanesulfonate monooxygenase SsuD/methylene tetrahydromethanopterin reductase-like flavin-dependent oxidoreductase (luciferase family)
LAKHSYAGASAIAEVDAMQLGVGRPATIPGARPEEIIEWARAAERSGFSTLGTLDRVVFDNYDPIPVLAAAAAVTQRIGLTTSILIGPYRGNGVILAKQLASIDLLSGGRLTVGIAVGNREDDYQATDTSYGGRGAAQEALLTRMRSAWRGEAQAGGQVGPRPARPGGPPLLIGGGLGSGPLHSATRVIRRVLEHGSGWISGGDPETFAHVAQQVRTAWEQAGRDGSPRLVSLGYFALGADAADAATRYLSRYYGFNAEAADHAMAGAMTSEEKVAAGIRAFADAGCDELILFPCNADPGQVDHLAAVATDYLDPHSTA